MGSMGNVRFNSGLVWNPYDAGIKEMRTINEIIIHCTATNPKWYADKSAQEVVDEIRRWHTEERGWSDIGYHAVIHRNGEFAYGRPEHRTGAHTRGRNKHSLGIALVGGRGGCSDDEFLDNFTEAQENSLRKLIDIYKNKHPIKMVTGHNDWASKACPCFSVEDWVEA
jgi:N-acetylmuramoyl-L-alanine amidase